MMVLFLVFFISSRLNILSPISISTVFSPFLYSFSFNGHCGNFFFWICLLCSYHSPLPLSPLSFFYICSGGRSRFHKRIDSTFGISIVKFFLLFFLEEKYLAALLVFFSSSLLPSCVYLFFLFGATLWTLFSLCVSVMFFIWSLLLTTTCCCLYVYVFPSPPPPPFRWYFFFPFVTSILDLVILEVHAFC